MQFNVLLPIIRKYMNPANYEVPEFVRELIAMITEVREEEWDTPKDPSNAHTNVSTLRNISKKGPTKKLAASIVYHLSSANFLERYKELGDDAKRLLAAELLPYDPEINADYNGTVKSDH